jgi:hypothetical protein
MEIKLFYLIGFATSQMFDDVSFYLFHDGFWFG